jgi:hypothetical protein
MDSPCSGNRTHLGGSRIPPTALSLLSSCNVNQALVALGYAKPIGDIYEGSPASRATLEIYAGFQRSTSPMIATINPDHGEPGNRRDQQLDSGVHRARAIRSMSHSDVVAPLRNTGEIADSKFSHHAALHAGENSREADGLLWSLNMGERRSNRFGLFHTAVVLACGGLAACSALPEEPAPVSVFPVYRITAAVTGGADRPVTESKPAADQGELRFVVVPRGQAVSGMVHARPITSRTAIASDRAAHPKKQKAHAEKVAAPVTTVEDASAELMPVN